MTRRPRIILATLLLSVVLSGASQAADRRTGGTVALVNVRVVSMDPDARKPVKKRQTVIVEDGRIVEIGDVKSVEVPEGAEVVNGKNKWHVLPGLADLHIHSNGIQEIPERITPKEIYSFYFANGVTTLLDMSGFNALFNWQRDIERGKVVGPDLYFASPIIDEENYGSLAALESDMRKFERQGYEYIKSHTITTPAFFERLFELAEELNLPVVAHALRPGFPIQDTLAQQPLMIAHIEEILSTSISNPSPFEDQLEQPLQDVASSRVWVTGTVNTYEIIANIRDATTFQQLLNRPEMRFVPPTARQIWEFDNTYLRPGFSGSRAFWLAQLDIKLYIARRLKQLGALDRLLLGTDTGVDLILPGFSIHDELRLLVRAGLTPWEAILVGTYNAAAFLDKLDEVGTVEVGKRANLMVARKNPLRKIGRLQDLAGVMVNGVWLSEDELSGRLEDVAERWE